jgi:hypothetical protein
MKKNCALPAIAMSMMVSLSGAESVSVKIASATGTSPA